MIYISRELDLNHDRVNFLFIKSTNAQFIAL